MGINHAIKKSTDTKPVKAKLFMNGRSQAVRLPAEFRFDGDEVFVRRDEDTGDIILSRKPETLEAFFEFARKLDAKIPDDFLSPEERDTGQHDRDPFEGWVE